MSAAVRSIYTHTHICMYIHTLHTSKLTSPSAGGGGGTQFRKDKIREKNIKLDENRAKRIDKEKNEKSAKQNQQGGGEDKAKQGGGGMTGGIHPSRLARNPGLGGR